MFENIYSAKLADECGRATEGQIQKDLEAFAALSPEEQEATMFDDDGEQTA